MKKKWFVQTLLALLCITVLCNTPAYAVETRASERIDIALVTLSKKSNGDLSIYFSVQATGAMEKIGASSVAVQRNTITGWVTEYRFNTNNTPALQETNSNYHDAVLTYSPLFSGAQYRAVVTIYVKDGSGVSTQQLTSRTV